MQYDLVAEILASASKEALSMNRGLNQTFNTEPFHIGHLWLGVYEYKFDIDVLELSTSSSPAHYEHIGLSDSLNQ